MKQYFMKKVFRIMVVTLTLLVCLLPASATAACASGQSDSSRGASVNNVTINQPACAGGVNTAAAKSACAAGAGNKVVVKVGTAGGDCAGIASDKYAACTACGNICVNGETCGNCNGAACDKTSCAADKTAANKAAAAAKAAETTAAPAKSETTAANTAKATTKAAPETTAAPANNAGSSVQDIERQVVTLVNQARRQNGLSELTLNEELCNVARVKANDMANNKYFSHTSPTYGSPFDMMKKFGISYRTAGENIAMGQTTARQVFDGWMNSEGHRANILNPNFTQIGVGYTANGNYWSQMFIG